MDCYSLINQSPQTSKVLLNLTGFKNGNSTLYCFWTLFILLYTTISLVIPLYKLLQGIIGLMPLLMLI